MKQRKTYIIDFRARTVTVYIGGAHSHTVNFQQALTVQLNIITKLVASLERNGFRRPSNLENGALVFEGWATP